MELYGWFCTGEVYAWWFAKRRGDVVTSSIFEFGVRSQKEVWKDMILCGNALNLALLVNMSCFYGLKWLCERFAFIGSFHMCR